MESVIDAKDIKVLEILKENSDYTTRKISKKTLLPITTVHNRIRKLKKEGIIKKFTVELDNKKMGKGLLVYLLVDVDLKTLKEKKKTQYDIAKSLNAINCVERVDIVAGGTDLVAIIRAKDVEEYDKLLLEKIQIVDGIKDTKSMIVIHEGK